MIVVVNMLDIARQHHITIDLEALEKQLNKSRRLLNKPIIILMAILILKLPMPAMPLLAK